MPQTDQPIRPRVFISHSSADKVFVRQLVEDLKKQDIPVWFDESDVLVGDSIVQEINSALSESDYLIVVLSKASVDSDWVKKELDYALMEEKSKDSIVILPVKIDDCEIPPLLRSRLYADFSQNYAIGLSALQRVFSQEKLPLREKLGSAKQLTACEENLAALSSGELRRRLKKLSRDELAVVWFDLFKSRMRDDMDGRTHSECLLELLLRAESRNKARELIRSVCSEREDLGEVRANADESPEGTERFDIGEKKTLSIEDSNCYLPSENSICEDWKKRKAFFLKQEAATTNASQLYEIQQQIAEADRQIAIHCQNPT